MRKKTVIAMCGRKGHGKDTVAKWFMDYLRHERTKRVAFADPIKEMAVDIFQWDGKKDKKGRRFLQLLGTEVGRCYNNSIWVDKAIDKIVKAEEDFIFVTDFRFPIPEYTGLKIMSDKYDYDLFVVKVVKTDSSHRIKTWWQGLKWKLSKKFGKVHSSERGVPKHLCDIELVNDFSNPTEVQEDIRSFIELELGVVVYMLEDSSAD